jgi:hypothetical protein
MRRSPRFFRLIAGVALGALLWDSVVPLAAQAQPAPPPLPPAQGQPNQNQGDPPARVGRVAVITGAVSFHNQGDTQWSPASVNYPVSSGNAFWTEPSAEAQLEVGDSRIALAGSSEFDVYALDAAGLQGVAMQGESYLHLRDLAPNEAWSVQTPRGLVRLGGEGRYGVVVGTTDQPTVVTVIDGSAQIEGPGVALQVAAGQSATLTGADSFSGSVGPAVRDGFLSERVNAERPPPAPAGVPAQVAVMPGGSDLYRVGSWTQAPEYGQVWYPPVSQGWVPYRQGHWAYVSPWGWTWIDDASWGFAPFHYGRWVQIGGRWAWTPGAAVAVSEPPVYAPALVTFIGIGAGVALGAALASGSIGWVPLGPREPYRPWYHASDSYVRRVNVNHVTNITNFNNVTINNYVNRGAATSVPSAAMMGSRPVQGVGRPVSSQEFAAARPIFGQQPLRPTAATAGVTPGVARQLHLAPAPMARPAPGPVLRAQAAGSAVAGFVRPPLAPGGRPGAANAADSNRPGGVPGSVAAPGAAPEASQPNRPGNRAPLVPGGGPNGLQPNRPGNPTPGSVPVPGGMARGEPLPGVTPDGMQPNRPGSVIPGVAPGALQPGHQDAATPGGRPAGAALPQMTHPGPPASVGQAPAAMTRPAVPQGLPRPEAAPNPYATPLHQEPRVVAPAAPPQHFDARPIAPVPRPEPPARPIPPMPQPQERAAPPVPQPQARPAAPVPQPQARPAPAPPVPQPQARPAPMPQPQARPAPPAPQPQARPAPPAHEKKPGEH